MISEIESLEDNISKLALGNSEQDYLQECLARTRKFLPEKETSDNIVAANSRWKEDKIHARFTEELDRFEERISIQMPKRLKIYSINVGNMKNF